MKRILMYLSVLFFLTLSCKNDLKIKKKVSVLVEKDGYKNIVRIQKDWTCDEVLQAIIKSSNLDFKNYINYFISIHEITDNFITAHVYAKNILSDNSKQLKVVENTIAWISFDPVKVKLYDTTVEREKPIELNFDRNIIVERNIFDLCRIPKRNKEIVEIYLKNPFLTEISNKYYGKNTYQSNTLKSNNYFKYFFATGDTLPKGSGKNFNANNYLYLQKVNKNRSKIASDSKTDTELYSVIVTRDNKIISTLEIDLKNGEFLNQLEVKKDDIISLKRKDVSNNSAKWKSYRITSNGKMVELQ
ncbi:hypothetical protein AR687_02250 [Flavobacteriaceae bacterium CRH]|nr:hypothetical protein AR687_02250 [Flavobacteriaceae bacterium CRH]